MGTSVYNKAPSTRDKIYRDKTLNDPERRKMVLKEFQLEAKHRAPMLRAAFSDKILDCNPLMAEEVIALYQEGGLELVMLEKKEISLNTITRIGLVLVGCGFQRSIELGKRMVIDCSAAGDPEATLQIVASTFLNTQTSNDSFHRIMDSVKLSNLRGHLKELAYTSRHPGALSLLGQMLERVGNYTEAVALYKEAVEQSTELSYDTIASNNPTRPVRIPMKAPWNCLGELLLRQGDIAGAKEAFRVGAFKGDDPLTYFFLAELEAKHSSKWLKYMTKAAASGYAEAAFNLGNFYAMEKKKTETIQDRKVLWHLRELDAFGRWKMYYLGDDKTQYSTQTGRTGMAWEWYNVATRLGHKEAGLALAEMARAARNWKFAAETLVFVLSLPQRGMAEEYPSAVKKAAVLKRQWVIEDERAGRSDTKNAFEAYDMSLKLEGSSK